MEGWSQMSKDSLCQKQLEMQLHSWEASQAASHVHKLLSLQGEQSCRARCYFQKKLLRETWPLNGASVQLIISLVIDNGNSARGPGKKQRRNITQQQEESHGMYIFAKALILEFLRFLSLNSYWQVLSGRKKVCQSASSALFAWFYFLCPVGYEEETGLYLTGEKKNPSLASDSRPFQNKSLTVVPLYFPGLLALWNGLFTVWWRRRRLESCLCSTHEAVPCTSLCSPGVASFYK